VGLVPQVESCQDPRYRIIPGHCISCDGEVASILLFMRKEWKDLDVVAVDRASNSSVALLQVLRKIDGLPPLRIHKTESDLASLEGPDPHDAVLLIGDAALAHRSSPLERIDLGLAWKERTGLPFVFAVWLTRITLPPWVIENLQQAARKGLAMRDQIAANFSQAQPEIFDLPAAKDYLQRCIWYDLGEAQKEALELFHRLRAEIDNSLDVSWRPRYLEEE
jgi:chorismate dehydratase